MATIIGGNGTGTLDSSLYLLNRNDTTGAGTPGHGEQVYINVSDGNLVLGHMDEVLPSETNGLVEYRTYNSQGEFSNYMGHGWMLSGFSTLESITANQIILVNGDGSEYEFDFDANSGTFKAKGGRKANGTFSGTDGPGAYESIKFDQTSHTYTLTQSNQTLLTFDNTGRLVKTVDTNGNTLTYHYDPTPKLASITDNSGHQINFIYQNGNITQITDETGAVFAQYGYSNGKLVSVTDRGGEVTTYSYDSNGMLSGMTLPSTPGEPTRALQFTYAQRTDGKLGISSVTDAQGNVTRFAYNFLTDINGNDAGGTTTVTDALGRVTTYSYDAGGQLTDVKDATGLDSVYTYDANENLVSQMDADGSAIVKSDSTYYRNLRQSFGIVESSTGQGKLVSELTATDIAGLQAHYTTSFSYDANGNLISRTDNSGNVTTSTFTSFNKQATSTSAEGNALVTSDNPQNIAKRQELGFIDPATGQGKTVAQLTAADKQALLALYTTTYTYDAHQNITQIQSPGGDLTAFTYDSFGNLTQRTVYLDRTNLTDPSKQEVTQYFYDQFGNNIKTIDAQGNSTYSTFDHFGNRTSQTDGRGGVTTYTYDAENRNTSTIDPLGNTTLNFYDAVGNRTAVTDANGHTVTYLYSANNLLIGVIDPSADHSLAATRDRSTSYVYDVMGNRTAATDAEGRITTYTYDALNRLITVTTPTVNNASGAAASYTSTFLYDALGNRISMTDNNGNRTDTVFNPSGLIQRVTDASGNVTEYGYDADLNQISIVVGTELAPAARQILKFDYDEKDRLISDTDALGNQSHFTYDGANNRISLTDKNGNTTHYTFDRDNRLLVTTRPAVADPATGNPLNYTVRYQYDANGNRVAVTDENGHTTTTAYDKDNRAIFVQDANGIQTVYGYDSRGNRISLQIGVQAHLSAAGAVVVDSSSNAQVTTYAYDEFNQVVSVTDGVGNALVSSDSALYISLRKQLGIVDSTGAGKHVAQLTASDINTLTAQFTAHRTYDRVGNYTSTTDHLGHTTSFTYDALGRLVKSTNALGQATSFAYDGNGNSVSVTDALGRTTHTVYDSLNRVTDTTDALGVTTHSVYDSFGNVISSTAASGTSDARTSTFVYDLDNRLITSTDPLGNRQSYVYDAIGNRLRVTDAKGQATNYVYDALNRNIAVIDPLGFQTRVTYDGVGNRISLIDARGGITRFTYDAGNREIQTQDAQGRLTNFTYDVRGNRVTLTTGAGSPEAETTTFVYDAQNHLRQTIDAAGNVSTQDFDAAYNRTRATDANGNSSTYSYDALNRLIRVTDAAGGITTYAYDAVSNRLSVTNANGHVTSYAYDAQNRVIQVTDSLGVTTTYGYDSVGNQIRVTHAANTSAASTTTYTYSLDDRLVSQTDALGHTQTNQYDANNNLVAVTDALGHVTHYAYDADNRVTSVTDALGNVTQYRYDANGNRTQIVDSRGFTSTRYYDADNEVVLSVDNDGYATGYTYDHNGNIRSETLYATPLALPANPAIIPTPATNPADRTTTFTYDALNRLASKTDGEGYVTQYVYDAVGNQIQTRQALDKAATQFEVTRSYYDNVNRQVARLSPQGYLTTYQYDALGNQIAQVQYDQVVTPPAAGIPQPATGDTGRRTAFVYDADNRLVSQTNPLGATTTYTYDARGNRISLTEAAGTSAARTTRYVYDAADRYIETTNALGITTHLDLDANGNVLRRHEAYGTGQERLYTFTYDANNRATSATDALGITTQTTYDASGNVTARTVAAGTSSAETSTFTYDGDSRESTAVDASGTTTTYAYNAAGNEVSLTQASGLPEARTNTFTYDRANRLVSATDALGIVTQYQYDGAGNKLVTTQATGTSQQRQSRYTYDLDNRLTRVTDPMGAVTAYQYDAQGNQTRIVNANGAVQVNTFDATGHLLTSLSAAGVLTRDSYDLRGNLISTTQSFADGSDARTSIYTYDLLNRQTLITDAEGFSTSIGYDDFGNQTTITHGQYLVPTTDPSYSAAKAAAAFPESNTLAYDADNRLLSLTDAVGNITTYQYDALGNRTSTTDGNGHTTQYTYDVLNRLTQTITPEGGITRYAYDHLGNRIAQDQLQSGSSASGVWAHTSYQYDANGHLIAKTDPLSIVTQYTYDAMGNQLSQTVAAGTSTSRTTRTEYDLDNRKTADVDALGNRTTYAYDAIGNRIKVTDALGHVAHYYYDGANQLREIVDPQGVVNTFAYDAAGNRTQTRVYMTPVTGAIDDHIAPTPTPGGQDRITTQGYDRANRLISQTAPDGSLTQFTYDGAGNRLTQTQFANTSAPRVLHFAYDADNRLTSSTDVDGAVTSFTYDAANNKLSETITSPNDPNPTRTTRYTYDANNRETSSTFDPAGLNIVQTLGYDRLGNVVSKTDGNGHTATFAYDLDNQQISQTDALGNTATFTYDLAGNKIAATDARGDTTNYIYDANNRLVQEIAPSVQIYTIGSGASTGRPTTTHVFDAVGNEVQTIDAAGNVSTRYFDGDKRVSAQINADNALTTYTYDAAGDKLSQTLYMTRLPASAQDPSTLPTAPAGASQQITYAYDLMGRVTQATYPGAQITTLVNSDANSPSSVTTTQQLTERNVYDAYGNVIASYDRNGNRTLNFYDTKDQRVATVDALGYLTEWDYDQQGNVLEQRQYTQALDPGTLTPGALPTPPSGDVAVTDIQYDAASRKIKETSPQISTFDPTTQTTTVMRPTTTYTYDKVGNQLTKVLGAGTAQAVTEYSYYDADNRRVAVVSSGRVLATYAYDANGNVVAQKRYFNTVGNGVILSQLSGNTNFAALVTADPSKDEVTDFTNDALNRQTSQSDLLTNGGLTRQTAYDADGNRTYTKDEDGYVTLASYDAMGRIAESVSPDGSGTLYQYDAAGNRVLVYTGVLTGGPPSPASGVAATLGAQVSLNWSTTGTIQQPIQTWVVYDTTSHQNVSDYANRTATQVSSNSHAAASLASAPSGSTVFFRVVTQDGAGNETWTAEQSLTIPPRFTALSVVQPSAGTLVVTARFDAGVTNPQIVYGAGTLGQSAAFVLQSDGTYQATLSGLSNPAALSYAIHWQDAFGNTYSSATGTFAATEGQVGVTTSVSQTQIVNGANTSYTLAVGTNVPTAYASGLTTVEAQWRVAGSGSSFAETAVTGTDSGQGLTTYSAVLGDTNNLAAGTYEIVIMGVRADGTSVELDHFNYAVGPGATSVTHNSVSWALPAVGNDQLVIIDGQNSSSLRDNGRVVATDTSASTSAGYNVSYGQDFADAHAVSVSSTANVTSGYDVALQATLSSGEAANIGSGGLHLAWRPAGTGMSFPNDVVVSSSGTNTYSATLSGLAAGQYDLELYYVDSSGHQVVLEWQRIDAATVNTTFNGHSLTVLAQESGGSINTSAQGVISVSPGLYTGSIDIAALSSHLSLSLTATGNAGGSLQTDGRATGYFSETQYDALGYKIASNEGDGLWRQFGVDGNGNIVQTDLLGERSDPNYNPSAPITTYTAYDARNRKVADFAAPVAVAGSTTPARPVTRYAYDFQDKTIAQTDPLGHTTHFAYNLLGTEIQQTDPFGATTRSLIDQFGNVTAEVTQLGHRTLKFYDLQGRLTSEQDAMGNTTTYTYDAFDRKLTRTDALGSQTRYSYDQRDRMISQTDPMGNSATYAYDGRNNRISTLYPLGQRTDQVYDGLGRVIDTQVYLNGQPTDSRTAYDAYGNAISETDAMGRTKTHVYGAFGRLLQDIDEDGNIIAYGYDVYGRRTNEYDPDSVGNPAAATDPTGGMDIQKTYDEAGRLTSITDLATGVSTTYTYDLAGQRLTEVITTPGNAHNRNMTYQYDALGQMVRYADSVTGDNLNRQFDAEGNLAREYTDSGYDPLGQNTSADSNYRYVDHVYSYDADRRVMQEVQRTTSAAGQVSDSVINGYTYDAGSNRITWNNAGTVVTYTYDGDGRALEGDYTSAGDSNRQVWTYDAMGNVLSYTTFKNGSQDSSTVSTYNDANRVVTSNKDGSITTNTYDATLRITQTVLQNKGKTYTYDYTYYGDGRERSIKAFGDANGNSTSTYDVNKVRVRVDLGQGDGQTRPEYKTFVADNEGHILFEFHDDGKSSQNATSEFLYANGAPIAENDVGTDGKLSVLLDTGSYAPVQNLSDSNPGNNLTYTIRAGDTLQSIALQMYGNASLWFVIAEANGLSAGEALKPGTQILIPNTIQQGTITADNHKVYSESEIVGSTLPNLKSPPPPHHGGCASILAIIIIVVIAIVVAVVTYGAGSALVGSLVGTTLSTTGQVLAAAAIFAVTGAVVAAVGSIIQQGLFIALGYQDKFSWKAVGSAAVSGALSGAAAGLGKLAAAGKILADVQQFAKVTATVLAVAGAASKQLIDGGKITSWTSLAAAGVGAYYAGDFGAANTAKAAGTLTQVQQSALNLQSTINYVSPWVQLAESGIRNGKLTPTDWANAVGATLGQAVDDHLTIQPSPDNPSPSLGDELFNSSVRLGAQSLVAGALSLADKNAAESYIENSVGQEAGQFIGQQIAAPIEGYFANLTQSIDQRRAANQAAATASPANAANSGAAPIAQSGQTTTDAADGVTKDDSGNPVGPAQTDEGTQAQPPAVQTVTPPDQAPSGPTTFTVGKEGSRGFWGIAKSMLDPDATNAEIQNLALQLMTANPGVTVIHQGDELNLPDGTVSQDAKQTYGALDKAYQSDLAQRREAAAAQAVPAAAPGTFSGDLALAQQNGVSMDQIAAARANGIDPSNPEDKGRFAEFVEGLTDPANIFGTGVSLAQNLARVSATTTQQAAVATSALYQRSSVFLVDAKGNVVPASTLTELDRSTSVAIGEQQTTYKLLEEVPEEARTTIKTTTSATAAQIAPGVVVAESEATTAVTETKALLNLGKAGTTVAKIAANPLTGGAITVAGNALQGKYDNLSAEDKTIAIATDAAFGTGISWASDALGVVVGVGSSPFITPVGGTAAGIGTAVGLNYAGSAGYNAYRTDIIRGVTSVVHFTSWVGTSLYQLTH